MSATTSPPIAPRKLRLTAPVPEEIDLQAAVADALDLLLLKPAEWCPLPIGHVKLTGQQAARLARIGTKPGWPDILVAFRGIYGIELKRQGGRLSTTRIVRRRNGAPREIVGQVDMFPRLLAAGFRGIAVCSSVEDVLCVIREWGCPVRGVS